MDADKYQRRLQLKQGDKELGEYYFGTSPGLRQTHGRRAGEDEVYALAINNYDMPADANDWLDKTRLSLSEVENANSFVLLPAGKSTNELASRAWVAWPAR